MNTPSLRHDRTDHVATNLRFDMPTGARTDLYRAKYGLPLQGETHDRFIATKVPQQRNKDYRNRFRSYSFGWPTYKRDGYTRHWGNFVDIMSNKDAPIMKYSKIFLGWFAFGMAMDATAKATKESYSRNPKTNLSLHKTIAANDYNKSIKLFDSMKSIKQFYRAGGYMGVAGTVWVYLTDFFRGYDYSMSQALARSSAILAPALVLIHADRPVFAFGYKSLLGWIFMYATSTTVLVFRYGSHDRSPSDKAEKYYLKSVSPSEIAKIEYEDEIELFAKRFEVNNHSDIYDYKLWSNANSIMGK